MTQIKPETRTLWFVYKSRLDAVDIDTPSTLCIVHVRHKIKERLVNSVGGGVDAIQLNLIDGDDGREVPLNSQVQSLLHTSFATFENPLEVVLDDSLVSPRPASSPVISAAASSKREQPRIMLPMGTSPTTSRHGPSSVSPTSPLAENSSTLRKRKTGRPRKPTLEDDSTAAKLSSKKVKLEKSVPDRPRSARPGSTGARPPRRQCAVNAERMIGTMPKTVANIEQWRRYQSKLEEERKRRWDDSVDHGAGSSDYEERDAESFGEQGTDDDDNISLD